MELKSKYFSVSMNTECKDILTEHMLEMIIELSSNAIFVMSTELEVTITGRIAGTITDVLKNNKFRNMPFHLVSEGFYRGSLGELGGTTRFTVRNVFTWMNAMYEKLAAINTERQTKEDALRRKEESLSFKQLQGRSNISAAAMSWKIRHCPMSDSEYDRLTLDKIVAALEKGYTSKELTPSMI